MQLSTFLIIVGIEILALCMEIWLLSLDSKNFNNKVFPKKKISNEKKLRGDNYPFE